MLHFRNIVPYTSTGQWSRNKSGRRNKNEIFFTGIIDLPKGRVGKCFVAICSTDCHEWIDKRNHYFCCNVRIQCISYLIEMFVTEMSVTTLYLWWSDDSQTTFLSTFCISIRISLKFVSECPIDKKKNSILALNRRQPLPESLLTQFTDAYVRHYRGRWVNDCLFCWRILTHIYVSGLQ